MLARRSSPPLVNKRLKDRRRRDRHRAHVLFAILLAVLTGAFIWLTWQPYVRIERMTISNGDPRLLALVEGELVGTYFGLVPRDSFFFTPARAIRATIESADAGIQAISVRHDDLTTLIIALHERVPIARWCGLVPSDSAVPSDGEYCYVFDAEGYLYAVADVAVGSTPLNTFTVYDSLLGGVEEPLSSTLTHARAMPDAFDFARRISSLGSPVERIIFKDDEVELLLRSGTRLTHVLGSEEETFANLMSAKGNFDLTDGSIDHVDLRFPAEVYLKRHGE